MGRIEDALAKMRTGESAAAGNAVGQRPIARVTDAVAPRAPHEHHYGGRYAEVDFGALRAQGLLAPDSHERRLADEYRVIKRPLVKNASNAHDSLVPRGNLLMVASAVPGEGKTFTCINLCLSLARENDWSVVLVDGDASKPHLTRLFGAEREPGLIELLRDPSLTFEQLVMPTNVPSFSLLPAGRHDEHTAELFASARMDAFCDELATSDPQRLIVFDSSPLLYTTEAPVLASQVGQVAAIVQADKTPQQAVIAAVSKLDHSKAINLVLNQASESNVLPGYGDYYYGSYGYGYGEQDG